MENNSQTTRSALKAPLLGDPQQQQPKDDDAAADDDDNHAGPVSPTGTVPRQAGSSCTFSSSSAAAAAAASSLIPRASTISPNHNDEENNNNEDDGDDEDDMARRRVQNEMLNASYGTLSPFQWILLGASAAYSAMVRVLVHFKLFAAHPLLLHSWHEFLVVADILRLVACLILEVYYETLYRGQSPRVYDSLWLHFVQHPWDALKPAVPVVLSLWQTEWTQRSVLYVPFILAADLSFYGVILVVAVFSTAMFQYEYSRQQWICLILGVLGACMGSSSSQNHRGGGGGWQNDWLWGLCLLLGAVAAGALALVYLERILKQDLIMARHADPPPPSFWMRGIQFSLYSATANAILWYRDSHGSNSSKTDDFKIFDEESFRIWAWSFAPAQTLGVLIIMAVLKYVTALHDKLSSLVAHAVALLLNYWVFGLDQAPSVVALYFSVMLMLASIYFFGQPLPQFVQDWWRDRQRQQPRAPQHPPPPFARMSQSYQPVATTAMTVAQPRQQHHPQGGSPIPALAAKPSLTTTSLNSVEMLSQH